MTPTPSHTSPRIVIIGSGFSGLGMGIQLKQAGFEEFTIFERGDRVGGVWRANTYPGAACDVFSNLYSYSFAPNPDWSRRYSPQAEIQAYLARCASENGLDAHLRFNTEVTRASFDAERKVWQVETAGGEVVEAEVLIPACGQLTRPAIPNIPGLEDFEGAVFHSAEWDHDYDLTGKKVAVIGTGASAIQFVPAIADEVEQLTVFQRSAPYLIPKMDSGYRWWHRQAFRRLPVTQAAARLATWLFAEAMTPGFTVDFGRLQPLAHPVAGAPLKVASDIQRRLQVRDPELRQAVTPDYEIGCKRVLFSSNWYPTLARPNVHLVTEAVREVTPNGVITSDGVKHEVDAIIFGTGFKTTEFLAPMEIRGLDGVEINEAWREGTEAYLGITVAGFPNLFLLYGPNTNVGFGSVVYMLESQFNYVLDAVDVLRRSGTAYLDVRPEVQAAFTGEVQDRLAASVWQSGGCTSWYKDARGHNSHNWPGLMTEYNRRTRKIKLSDYRVMA